ncbi:hypothetical protein DPQ22_00475 [Candidatus Tokpelaia sp.]|nr:hypothetical protein DPQ22_00475 [Candidatus Tokpelaia sp.]
MTDICCECHKPTSVMDVDELEYNGRVVCPSCVRKHIVFRDIWNAAQKENEDRLSRIKQKKGGYKPTSQGAQA